jgi:signal transduction histidine kinase
VFLSGRQLSGYRQEMYVPGNNEERSILTLAPDYYHAPAIILTALLLPAFGHLYLRSRDTRSLFWFLAFVFSLASMVLLYTHEGRRLFGFMYPWDVVLGQTCLQTSTALFLGSLSPLRFRVGRFQILYVIPYMLPLIVASILAYGVFAGTTPRGLAFWIFPVLGAICFTVGMFWGAKKGSVPAWLGMSFSFTLGTVVVWVCFTHGPTWALTFAEFANLQMAVVLLICVFRRFSPGVVLSVMGFVAWSLFVTQMFPAITSHPNFNVHLLQIMVMGKVIAAMGMILLTLEDELVVNRAGRERERRARQELEAYTKLILARRRVEDFDRQGTEVCETVVAQSRFAQAALLLYAGGHYRLAGYAGLDDATAKALDSMACRILASGFLDPSFTPPAVEQSQALRLDLTPWLLPGDDLKRLGFTSVLAVPMINRSVTEGALLLSGIRPLREAVPGKDLDALRADDLLPIEMLAGRLQATRSQTMMFEKLIDSEKFGHLGQLASNVTQQLNNPLTVILGYASLLDETANLSPQDRKGIASILTEARHMRTTLESLSRISRSNGDQLAAISVVELLSDMEELHRSEFLQRAIDFRLSIAPSLPRVMCSAQQLRQAIRHCLQFAMEAVDNSPSSNGPRTIRLEAASEGNLVQILIAHSGSGFLNPERAFDPFTSTQNTGKTAGLGLSLCATILRDNKGRASAINFEPTGAAIILELQSA